MENVTFIVSTYRAKHEHNLERKVKLMRGSGGSLVKHIYTHTHIPIGGANEHILRTAVQGYYLQ